MILLNDKRFLISRHQRGKATQPEGIEFRSTAADAAKLAPGWRKGC